MANIYTFTDKERAYVAKRMKMIESAGLELQGALNLIGDQQGLTGRFDLAPDQSGLVAFGELEKVDA